MNMTDAVFTRRYIRQGNVIRDTETGTRKTYASINLAKKFSKKLSKEARKHVVVVLAHKTTSQLGKDVLRNAAKAKERRLRLERRKAREAREAREASKQRSFKHRRKVNFGNVDVTKYVPKIFVKRGKSSEEK